MKTLVLAAGSSPGATNAAFFAGKLALDQHTQLILLHACQATPQAAA